VRGMPRGFSCLWRETDAPVPAFLPARCSDPLRGLSAVAMCQWASAMVETYSYSIGVMSEK
jgi:hypothetical protein